MARTLEHPLRKLEDSVEHTHRGLGRLLSSMLLAAKARKCMIIVAPAGCGKSAALRTLTDQWQAGKFIPDSVTRASLRKFNEKLSNWSGIAACDDFAAADNWYNRVTTLTTYTKLCYDHRVEKHTMSYDITINNFNGSALINMQPIWLDSVVKLPEWEGLIRDKTLRYYHLHWPTDPVLTLPQVHVPLGHNKPLHAQYDKKSEPYKKLLSLASVQWGRARAQEHLRDLLWAAAAIREGRGVTQQDVETVHHLLQPMNLEYYLVGKTGFESGRYFLVNAYYILTVLASFKPATQEDILECFKVSRSTLTRLMATVQDYAAMITNSPKKILPTELSRIILKAAGEKA